MRGTRRLAVLAIVAAAAVPIASAAAQDPAAADPSVASVGDRLITEQEFDSWLRKARRSSASTGRPADPPTYERCRRQASMERCARRYAALRRQVMEFLIQGAWVREEAEAHGISVSPSRVRREFKDQRRQAFPRYRDYRRFLRQTGTTEEDILYRVELDMLQSRLAAHATEKVRRPTRDEVTRYVQRNRKRMRHLNRRDRRSVAHNVLRQRFEQRALQSYIDDFRERSRAKTVCAEGYVVPDCGNAPRS